MRSERANMKYITSVSIQSSAAQAAQVTSMTVALSKLFDEFTLFSAESSRMVSKINNVFPGQFRRLKKVLFLLNMQGAVKKGEWVYTRDVLVAAYGVYRGAVVIYESHQRPTFLAALLLKFMRDNPRFLVVTISQALKHYLVGALSICETKVKVLHDGASVPRSKKLNAQLSTTISSLKKNSRLLVHTGSLGPGRGAQRFGEILENVEEVSLLHVGGTARQCAKNGLNELLDRHPDRFRFFTHLPRDQIPAIQSSADYLLFPMGREVETYWCCSPLKIFEYMVASVPIICSSVGTITEILDRENAFFFDPSLRGDVVSAVRRALNASDSEIRHMTERNYAATLQRFNWEKRACDALRFFETRSSL